MTTKMLLKMKTVPILPRVLLLLVCRVHRVTNGSDDYHRFDPIFNILYGSDKSETNEKRYTYMQIACS